MRDRRVGEWIDESGAGVRSLCRCSRRLAGESGAHCFLSLGGMRGRDLGVAGTTRSVLCLRGVFVDFGRSPSERENTWELMTRGDLIRLMVEGDLRGVVQAMGKGNESPDS